MKIKSYAAKTDQGPYLQINEDSYEIDLVNELFMIFDGFGGSGIGDKTVTFFKENIRTFYTRVVSDPESTLPFFYGQKYLLEGNALINALNFSHKIYFRENKKLSPSRRGGASNITAAKSENILTIVGTGNCVAYLYREGELLKLMNEDTIGVLSSDNFESHLQTVPMSALGLFEELYLQTREIIIRDGDIFVFMTDGIYAWLKAVELQSMMDKCKGNLYNVIDKAIEITNSRGNLDNQSMMLLCF